MTAKLKVVATFSLIGFLSAWIGSIIGPIEEMAQIVALPVSVSLALLIAIRAGWFPPVPVERRVNALFLVFLAAGLMVLFVAPLGPAMVLPSLALAAMLLRRSVTVLTSRRPKKLARTLLLCTLVCIMLWVGKISVFGERDTWPTRILIGMMVMSWAGSYGKALMDSEALASGLRAPA